MTASTIKELVEPSYPDEIPYDLLFETVEFLKKKTKLRIHCMNDYDCIITGLKRVLGNDQTQWGSKIQNPPYLNEELGRKLFLCFRPVLPKSIALLDSGFIADGMKIYDIDPHMDFSFHHPMQAGVLFEPKEVRQTRYHGFIINTSPNVDHGTHWVSVFVDVKKGKVEYFDSMGGTPNGMVHKTITSIVNAIEKHFEYFPFNNRIQFSPIRKQYGGVECGMYAMIFLVVRLHGKSLKQITDMTITDSDCSKLRDYFFSHRNVDTSEFEIK